MPSGKEFITHEFDEAIAIERSIVENGAKLSKTHPVAAVKRQLTADLQIDRRHLATLEKLGAKWGAKGKLEEVAGALSSLADETSTKTERKAAEESDSYEAHAVILNLKRKQQDSADAMVKLGRDRRDTELRDAGMAMKREIKASADALGKSLAAFAVRIASA